MRYRNCSADGAGFVELGGSWVCGRCGCSNQGGCCAQCGWVYRTGGGVVQCGSRSGHDAGCGTTREAQRCTDSLQLRSRNSCSEARSAESETALAGGELLCFCLERGVEQAETSHGACQDGVGKRIRRSECAAPRRETCSQTDAASDGTVCAGDAAAACGGQRLCRKVGMVYAVNQALDRVYESPSALKAGTLFPELHKPLNGYCPDNGRCAQCGQAEAFSLWELRLYLNTHPDDREALGLFRRLCAEAQEPNYASAFLNAECSAGKWEWVDDPWPWEKCANRCE